MAKYRRYPITCIMTNMIYLIGGSPRCGKTKVAKALAKKTHIPWFPADYLGSVIFQYIPETERDAKFPLSAIRDIDDTNDYRYSNYTAEQIVDFYYTQAEAVWSGLHAFIKYTAHDKQDFIIEGYQVTPELLSRIDEETKKSIKSVFLYKQDLKEIESGIKKNEDPGDWLLNGNTKDEETFSKVAKMINVFGVRTLDECEKYNVSVFNMDVNFDKKINEVVNSLIS